MERPSPEAARIDSPELLSPDNPSFLCDTCSHINFKWLIYECPLDKAFTKIPLGSYSAILQRQNCAFCRLIKHAFDNLADDGVCPADADGETVAVSVMASWESSMLDFTNPRELSLIAEPTPLSARSANPTIQASPKGTWLEGKGAGRVVDTSQISPVLVLAWSALCRLGVSCHSDPVPEATADLPKGFRLIDVQRMCVVPADASMRYTTLSYLWGTGLSLQLRSSNCADLLTEGSLSRAEEDVPQTIKDAIELIRTLPGERYLWVDALCILQDDAADKATQISSMDRIYGSAFMTIVAAHGDGPHAGLPGVRPNSRKSIQRIETVQGLRLSNRLKSLEDSVSRSKWNTRGWTFQERMLSRRTLFIGEQQAFFACGHLSGPLSEDHDSKPRRRKPEASPVDMTGPLPIRGTVNVLTYLKVVEAFTKREITFEYDVLNAFEGVARRMYPMFRSDFVVGLPRTELDYCLLWEPAGRLRRRLDCDGNALFSSWSWAGWVGEVQIDWTERIPRIKWLDESANEVSIDEYRRPYVSSASDPAVTKWREGWREEWTRSDVRYYHHVSDPDLWFRNPTAEENERRPRLGPVCDQNTGYLRFRAWTTDLNLKGWKAPDDIDEDKGPLWTFHLRDKAGYIPGYLRVPVSVVRAMGGEKSYDIIIICRTRYRLGGQSRPDKPLEDLDDDEDTTAGPSFFPEEAPPEEDGQQLVFDRQRYDARKAFCLYEFLVVEWRGDVAYRIGIGKMHIDALAETEPKWKTITLG